MHHGGILNSPKPPAQMLALLHKSLSPRHAGLPRWRQQLAATNVACVIVALPVIAVAGILVWNRFRFGMRSPREGATYCVAVVTCLRSLANASGCDFCRLFSSLKRRLATSKGASIHRSENSPNHGRQKPRFTRIGRMFILSEDGTTAFLAGLF